MRSSPQSIYIYIYTHNTHTHIHINIRKCTHIFCYFHSTRSSLQSTYTHKYTHTHKSLYKYHETYSHFLLLSFNAFFASANCFSREALSSPSPPCACMYVCMFVSRVTICSLVATYVYKKIKRVHTNQRCTYTECLQAVWPFTIKSQLFLSFAASMLKNGELLPQFSSHMKLWRIPWQIRRCTQKGCS